VSQTLFSVTLQVRTAQAELRNAGLGEDHPTARALAEVNELNHGALAEMRALIFELRPGALAEEGLVASVSKHAAAVAAREGIDVDVTGPADRLPLGPEAEEQLYRLTQEALNNVVKHARTVAASVVITSGPAQVTVAIRDDGIGFDPDLGRPGHLGLASMRERVTRLGGRLDVASAPGSGTTITATLPTGVPPDQGGTT
jgi:signal transduction histidine kinase